MMLPRILATILMAAASAFALAAEPETPDSEKIKEFSARYSEPLTMREKIEFCIDLVDTGTIVPGAHVQNIDRIFGTDYAHQLPDSLDPAETKWLRSGCVHFGGYYAGQIDVLIGWSFCARYDRSGTIQDPPLLTTYHKVNPKPVDNPVKVKELNARFKYATTERQRIEVCIEAIDCALITFLSKVTIVDAIFGTDFANGIPPTSEIAPSQGDYLDVGVIHCGRTTSAEKASDQPSGDWCLVLEVANRDKVVNYYLTKLPGKKEQRRAK